MQSDTVVAKLKARVVKNVTRMAEEKAMSVLEKTRESLEKDKLAGAKVMIICGAVYIIYKNSPHLVYWWNNLQFEATKGSKKLGSGKRSWNI